MRQVQVRIEGKVQGVSFRAWTQAEARSLGLRGWVENRPDGSVAVRLDGEDAAVEEMLDRLKKGPPAARVDAVSPEAQPGGEAPDGFEITG